MEFESLPFRNDLSASVILLRKCCFDMNGSESFNFLSELHYGLLCFLQYLYKVRVIFNANFSDIQIKLTVLNYSFKCWELLVSVFSLTSLLIHRKQSKLFYFLHNNSFYWKKLYRPSFPIRNKKKLCCFLSQEGHE